MQPILVNLPVWPILLMAGGLFAHLFFIPLNIKGMLRTGLVLGAALLILAVGLIGDFAGKEFPIRGYGTMVLIGFLLAVYIAARRAKNVGLEPVFCLDLGLWILIGGLAGSRLFYVFEFWEEYSPFQPGRLRNVLGIFEIWKGGLVYYGGLISSFFIIWWYCGKHRVRIIPMMDLASPSAMIGLALGRVGCFLNGCCFGKTCTAPWGVKFPPQSAAYADFYKLGDLHPQLRAAFYMEHPTTPALHPTQLYAVIGALLCTACLYAIWPRRMYDGFMFGLMLIMAGTTRFFEEVMRADNPVSMPQLSDKFTVAQWIGVAFVVVGLSWLAIFRRSGPPLQNIRY